MVQHVGCLGHHGKGKRAGANGLQRNGCHRRPTRYGHRFSNGAHLVVLGGSGREQELVDQAGGGDGQPSVLSVVVHGGCGGVERAEGPRSRVVFITGPQGVDRRAGGGGLG